MSKAIVGIMALIMVVGVVASAIAIVPAGHRGVLLEWSAVDTTNVPLEEGIHIITPIKDSVINMEIRTLKHVEEASAASKDLQIVDTEVTVNYHLSQDKVNALYKNVGLEYTYRIITPAVEETLKQVTANYQAEELITKRPQVKQDISDAIEIRLREYNIITEVVSITNFDFSTQYKQAVESKEVAKQNAQKAENDLIRIEVEAKQQEAQAIGAANAEIAKAEGKAKAIAIFDYALKNNPEYLKLYALDKWDGVLPLVISDNAAPFISIPNGAELSGSTYDSDILKNLKTQNQHLSNMERDVNNLAYQFVGSE